MDQGLTHGRAQCPVCAKDVSTRLNHQVECSHVDCPNRRHCWSDGTPKPHFKVVRLPTFDPLFDNKVQVIEEFHRKDQL